VYYENGTVNWLKTGDLNDGYFDYIPEKITDLALKECSVRLNPKDSV
jgi:type I restriction enzyme S subunit